MEAGRLGLEGVSASSLGTVPLDCTAPNIGQQLAAIVAV